MERRKKCATLKDVAQLANVSVATASIVLNGRNRKKITEETISNVLQAASELHYQPDLSAQMLKGKTSTIIGLVIPDISNPFYPEMTKGVTDCASDLGYNVVLFNTDNNIQEETFAIETLSAMRVAGIVLCGVYEPGEQEQNIIRHLQSTHMPIVQVDRHDARGIAPYVSIDNFRAAYEITELLIRLGHKRIATVATDMHLFATDERIRGYYQALRDYSLQEDEKMHIRTHITEMRKADAKKAVDGLQTAECSAAFIIDGDLFALACINELKRRGTRVPEDISVVGFDGIYAAGIAYPGLTTVNQPKYEMGRAAVELLCSIIKNPDVIPRSIVLNHEIIRRDSVCKYSHP